MTSKNTPINKFVITNSEKILLLLSEFRRYENDYRLPEELSQDGIARIVGMRRGNVARELIKLKERGFVEYKLAHFEGSRRRRKGYFLTDAGFNLSVDIKKHVKNKKIILIGEDGAESEMDVYAIKQLLGKEISLTEVVAKISEEGIFDVKVLDTEKPEEPSWEEVYTSKFVGRDDELIQIQEIFQEALKGEGCLLLISGEAGIGKTRLINELKKLLDLRMTYFLQGNCLYQTAVDPYIPFVEVFKSYLDKADKNIANSAISKITSTAPEFIDLFPAFHDDEKEYIPSMERGMKLNDERVRIFETINNVILSMATGKSVVIFIDDLHWADLGSLHLLHYLARNTRGNSILLIGAYRPEELVDVQGKQHPLKESLLRLKREELVKEIALDRLNLAETKLMVKNRLDKKLSVSDEFAALIHEKAEGNPFFIEEMLDILEDTEIEKFPDKVSIPKSISDTIMRRVNILGKNERTILENSTVIGTKFDFEVLARITKEKDEVILDLLDVLCKANLIDEEQTKGEEGYRFNHCMIQEVIYRNLSKIKRRKIHERIGEVLEELYKDNLDEGTSELAYHFSNTKDFNKAYEYSWKAGEKAASVYSFDEAVHNYEITLRALIGMTGIPPTVVGKDTEAPERDQREGYDREFISKVRDGDIEIKKKLTEVFDRLGYAWDILGKWDESIQSYNNAVDLTDDENKKAGIEAKIGVLYVKRGMFDEALEKCEKTLKTVDDKSKERCMLLDCIAGVHINKGEFERALDYLNESLKFSESMNEKKITASVCYLIGSIYTRMGDDNKGLEYLERSLKLREELGDQRGISISYMGLGNLYGMKGEFSNALHFLFKCLDIKKKMGDQVGISDAEYNIGLIYARIKEFEKALEYYKKSLAIKEKIGDLPNIAVSRFAFGSIYRDMGDYNTAEKYIGECIEICEQIGYNELLAFALNELAMCVIRNRNDLENAMNLGEKSVTISRNIGLKETEGVSILIFAEVHREKEQWDMSIKKYEEAIEIFKSIPRPVNLSEAYFEFAKMWKKKRDLDKAKEYFEQALAILKESGLDKNIESIKKELAELEN